MWMIFEHSPILHMHACWWQHHDTFIILAHNDSHSECKCLALSVRCNHWWNLRLQLCAESVWQLISNGRGLAKVGVLHIINFWEPFWKPWIHYCIYPVDVWSEVACLALSTCALYRMWWVTGNELCLRRTSTIVFYLHLVYLKPV